MNGKRKDNIKTKKIASIIISFIVCILLVQTIEDAAFYKPITFYGNKSFEGAQVYVNMSRAGTMVWDDKEKFAYAREERLLCILPEILNQSDRLLVMPINGETDIKIITKKTRFMKTCLQNTRNFKTTIILM